ncbi:MAG: ATP-binding protein [Actinomycetota bacterium]|nr:ATP-binding protein [Actinomycetota bacterium]
MNVRFRVWMPPIAILIVLVAVLLVFAYGIPAAKQRLEQRTQAVTLAQAAATADAITGEDHQAWQELLDLPKIDADGQTSAEGERPGALRRSLDLYATAPRAEVRVVNRQGEVVAREGERLFSPPPEMLRKAASGERFFERTEDLNVAVVPILYSGELAGGVVLATRQWEAVVYEPFLRSGLEAAVLASLIGGGLMFLLAAMLSRRVERLSSGARLIERGDLSHRIEPGFGDELGALAKTLNSMAANLEESFGRLAEKDATLGAILDNLSEGVVATNTRGTVVFANPAGRAMLGMGEEDVELPNPWEDFDLREAVASSARKREGGEASVRGKKSFLRIKLEYMPNLGEGGKDGVLIVAQDLSEGRRLEEAQQKFLARAAHQLRTPLSAITFAAELLVTKGDDPVARRRFLEHILTAAERMRRLSDSLLKLARVGWGTREPELEPVDLSEVAHVAAEVAKPLAESAGLDVTVEGSSARVVADLALLEEALLIPITNAIQHSEPGKTVRLRLSGASVTVEDRAGGIAEEDLPHLFERFYTGRGSSGGTGLGLPICKDLVERMGGEVSIRSEKGVGTSVRIELPEAEPDA